MYIFDSFQAEVSRSTQLQKDIQLASNRKPQLVLGVARQARQAT